MSGKKKQNVIPPQKPNFNRHQSQCTICAHPECEEIEREFISWKSTTRIATDYNLRDRSAIYRHAHALNLFSKRDRNLRGALGRFIEQIDEVPPSAGVIVQAIALFARLNARGEFAARDEQVSGHNLFDEMQPEEIEAYAKDGTLPSWFPRLKIKNDPQGSGGSENE